MNPAAAGILTAKFAVSISGFEKSISQPSTEMGSP